MITSVIRGILEIALGIYLINHWHDASGFIRWFVTIATIIAGLLSIINPMLKRANQSKPTWQEIIRNHQSNLNN